MSGNWSPLARTPSMWLQGQPDDGVSMGPGAKGRANADCSKNAEPDLQNAPQSGPAPSCLAVSPRCGAIEHAGQADAGSYPAGTQHRIGLYLSPTIGDDD